MSSIGRWNARYSSGETGPSAPHRLAVEASAMSVPGFALDLACGTGRNARYLAGRGWKVVGLDGSIVALRMVEGARAVLADLERDPLPFRDELFDLILIINFMHRPLFAEALRVLRPGGVVAAAVHTSGNYALSPEELRAFFGGLTIALDREGEIIAVKGTRS